MQSGYKFYKIFFAACLFRTEKLEKINRKIFAAYMQCKNGHWNRIWLLGGLEFARAEKSSRFMGGKFEPKHGFL